MALYHRQARRHVINIKQDIGKSCILTFFFAFTVVVDLLFNVLSIICGSSVFVFVLLYITLCPVKFCNHLEKEEKAGCFAIIVLQIYFYYKCSVAHHAVGWSAVCDCGIS